MGQPLPAEDSPDLAGRRRATTILAGSEAVLLRPGQLISDFGSLIAEHGHGAAGAQYASDLDSGGIVH